MGKYNTQKSWLIFVTNLLLSFQDTEHVTFSVEVEHFFDQEILKDQRRAKNLNFRPVKKGPTMANCCRGVLANAQHQQMDEVPQQPDNG